ncbi:hypothetical protein DTO013E5_9787 [Penicillium roqueforti]|nr:hypothetical protein CBS147337_10110 [Penicillium roqueforti]KAI2674535.1 hypothetical protein CBS147355_7149 [Penicillium roqueforti]KAI2683805.1 hypothetical protein LCP963914a_5635 [Penicillium roqueforti]KAI2698754.1 hypothetical protein CBS147354_9856 [Penicillium roqueforti]KAI2709050.1 hypothetical protein CBS147332_6109 [Penicillium roqueforti]
MAKVSSRKMGSPEIIGTRSHGGKKTTVLMVGHMMLFTVYAIVFFVVVSQKSKSAREQGLPISPAIPAIRYEARKFTLEDCIQEKGSFSGKPSAEVDKAWHDLLNTENIIIEPEIMTHYGREDIGVAVPEGDGYLGTLNVYHELHCLKRLHQYMYPHYYFPDLTPEQHEMNRLHNKSSSLLSPCLFSPQFITLASNNH